MKQVIIFSTFLSTLIFNSFFIFGQKNKLNCLPTSSAKTGLEPSLETRIIDLIDNGNNEKLELYLSNGKPNLNVIFSSKHSTDSPLIYTLEKLNPNYHHSREEVQKYFQIIKTLVKYGADPNGKACYYDLATQDIKGYYTAISQATFNTSIKDFLIESSSEIDFNRELLLNSIENGDISLLQKFSSSKQKISTDQFIFNIVYNKKLSQQNKIKAIDAIIAKGGNLNEFWSTDNYHGGSVTPLTLACENGELQLVRFLIEKGANPNLRGRGVSPLGIAVFNDNLELVKLLISLKANLKQPSSYPGYFKDSFIPLIDIAKSETMKDFLYFGK